VKLLNKSKIRQIVWPLIFGGAVAFLAAKAEYSLSAVLTNGSVAALYAWMVFYAVLETNLVARLLRAVTVTSALLYLIHLMTGMRWSLIPWSIVLFLVCWVVFIKRWPKGWDTQRRS
jgi:uncharacterized membrane protein YGL010W